MLQHPTAIRKAFEVTIYNKHVRIAIKNNQSHDIYNDRWADPQNQNVMASDEIQAMHLINLRYPKQDGFVVQKLSEYHSKFKD